MNRFARSAALGGAALARAGARARRLGDELQVRPKRCAVGRRGGDELRHVRQGEAREGRPEEVEGLHRLGQPAGRPGRDRRAGDRRRRAGREVRERPARRRRRPSGRARRVLHQVERGGRHDLRSEARQRQADLRHRDGRRRHGSPVAVRDDPRHEAGRHGCRHHPGRRSVEDRRRPLRRRPAHPPAVRQLREERPQGQDRGGHLPERAGHRRVRTGDRGRAEGGRHRHEAGRLHAGPDRPDRAADRGRSDDGGLHRPVRHGVRLREPGEGAPAARHHRLAQDHDRAALPQLDR